MNEQTAAEPAVRFFDGPHGRSHVLVYDAKGADTVALLHSGGMSGQQWRRAIALLRGKFRLIVPDMLGMGESPPWPEQQPFHFEQDLQQLRALLQDEPRLHLVGHSYGAFLALKWAQQEPARPLSLALFEPPAFGVLSAAGDPLFAEVQQVRAQSEVAASDAAGRAEWLRGFIDYWNHPGAWQQLSAAAQARYLAVAPKLAAEVRTLLDDQTPAEAYQVLEMPTLLLGGELSPASERAVLARLAAALPKASVEWFAGAGHLAPITHAVKVAERIYAHLRRSGALCTTPDQAL